MRAAQRLNSLSLRIFVGQLFFLLPLSAQAQTESAASLPNIVVILADDLGFGDLSCQGSYPGAQSRIATPCLDELAASGMRFTDAHSPSSVCTPTRYALLTGRYAWRTRLQSSVLLGYDPPLIAAERQTFASLLKSADYRTACIGKWHLGLDWVDRSGKAFQPEGDPWQVDYEHRFEHGPQQTGFDHFFGISASLDMPPYVYLSDDRAAEVPTVEKTWIRKGPASVDFEAEQVLPRLITESVAWINECAEGSKAGTPFLLYLPLTAPHTPILPTAPWQGRSGINDYADFTMQVDAAVGEVLTALERNGLTENTLVVFTSDNGCSPQANFTALAAAGHSPSGPFRGHKADIYEGGHRIPLLIRWPGTIAPESECDRMVSLVDLTATLAEIAGIELEDSTAEDSFSMLPLLKNSQAPATRLSVVMHSIQGAFAIRRGDWKLAVCPGSGGWSAPVPGKEPADAPAMQLFHLQFDPSEQVNRINEQPELAGELLEELKQLVSNGRSTDGPKQSNDVEVDPLRGVK